MHGGELGDDERVPGEERRADFVFRDVVAPAATAQAELLCAGLGEGPARAAALKKKRYVAPARFEQGLRVEECLPLVSAPEVAGVNPRPLASGRLGRGDSGEDAFEDPRADDFCLHTVPFEKRLLLMPKCIRIESKCPAPFDEFGLLCKQCGLCSIQDFQNEAEKLGYAVIASTSSNDIWRRS